MKELLQDLIILLQFIQKYLHLPRGMLLFYHIYIMMMENGQLIRLIHLVILF